MRAAVYSGTRNVYQNMLTSAKSLLQHSNVQKIYFLIQDNNFPFQLSQEFQCINVKKQQFFKQDGPNFTSKWTYMVLLRAAYTKIFPQLDRILSMDIDTIVNENISQLWELNLSNYYMAAVKEIQTTQLYSPYINMGVSMLNLKKIREQHKDDEIIKALNTYWYPFKQQDCLNEFFRNHILFLSSDYNVSIYNPAPKREKVIHFAGFNDLKEFPHFNYYKNLSLQDIERNKKDNITLDIIIPTYKNKKQLRRTLNSITFNKRINVIVVDDFSEMDYSDILEEYPQIHFYYLKENMGPGMARQYGIQHSNGTYITFLDSGDYFYHNGLETILNEIQNNTYIKFYSFSYVYDNNNVLEDKPGNKTIGNVYKRSFIEMYNICFCKEGSYADQDYGFNTACRLTFDHLQQIYHFHPMRKHIYIPTFYEHISNKSLTKINNSEFSFTKFPQGIIINGIHAISNTNITMENGVKQLCHIMAIQYYAFIMAVSYEYKDINNIWKTIRNFYFQYYHQYKKFALKFLQSQFKFTALPLIQKIKRKKIGVNYNMKRFIEELETEENCPSRYLT